MEREGGQGRGGREKAKFHEFAHVLFKLTLCGDAWDGWNRDGFPSVRETDTVATQLGLFPKRASLFYTRAEKTVSEMK